MEVVEDRVDVVDVEDVVEDVVEDAVEEGAEEDPAAVGEETRSASVGIRVYLPREFVFLSCCSLHSLEPRRELKISRRGAASRVSLRTFTSSSWPCHHDRSRLHRQWGVRPKTRQGHSRPGSRRRTQQLTARRTTRRSKRRFSRPVHHHRMRAMSRMQDISIQFMDRLHAAEVVSRKSGE